MSAHTAIAGSHPMQTTTPPPDAGTPAASGWPRVVILIIAAIELFDSLQNLAFLFGDLSQAPGSGWGVWAVMTQIVLEPLCAMTALVLGLQRRLAGALIALAAIIALQWLSFLPSHINHWGESQGGGFWPVFELASFVGYPLLALAAIALAWRNTRLGLATILIAIPMAIDTAMIIAFAASVMIYGF